MSNSVNMGDAATSDVTAMVLSTSEVKPKNVTSPIKFEYDIVSSAKWSALPTHILYSMPSLKLKGNSCTSNNVVYNPLFGVRK